jgi:hypothetical protein
MAGTNVVAAKKALIAKIAALDLGGEQAGGVQVAYSWPGRNAEREVVHGGLSTFDQNPLAFRAGGRCPRQEDVTVEIHVAVTIPGGSEEDVDTRAAEIGTVIEDAIAADPTLADALNLKIARVDGGELESGFNDDAAAAVLTYRIILKSTLD